MGISDNTRVRVGWGGSSGGGLDDCGVGSGGKNSSHFLFLFIYLLCVTLLGNLFLFSSHSDSSWFSFFLISLV